jgi:CRP/FNR family cyclic AMP-dependent transcriptional regulator
MITFPVPVVIEEQLLKELARHGPTRWHDKNTTLIKQGDIGTSMYVILSGSVAVYLEHPGYPDILLHHLGAVSYVGEMALGCLVRCATVRTLSSTLVAELSWNQVSEAIHLNPAIATILLSSLINRHRQTSFHVRSGLFLPVYDRLKALLQALTYVPPEAGSWSVERLAQTEMARRIGASRDMVGRIVRDLMRGGYIEVRAKHVRLLRRLPERW